MREYAEGAGIDFSRRQIAALADLQNKVLAANEYMNLTAITRDDEFTVKHIIDSLTLLPYIKQGASLVDIGTGAGFPGIVLGIMREDIKLTLIESTGKKVNFLRETLEFLKLSDVECVHGRAEEWARQGYRYDVCTARAVAKLDKLAGYALPILHAGGMLFAMKGKDVLEEIENAKPALKKKGGVFERVDYLKLTDDITHSVVVVKKAATSK